MDTALAEKLKIKPHYTLLVLNAPAHYLKRLKNADEKPASNRQYDFVQLFVDSKATLDKLAGKTMKALKPDGLFWVCYPKKGSSLKTDINRDYGWESITKAGFQGVSQISIDETWSALRFRHAGNEQKPNLSEKQIFTGVIESPENVNGGYITIPFNVEKVYKTKGLVKVRATFDGYPYRGALANMGTGCHIIIVRKDIRETIGKNVGDKVNVVIERDTEERTVEVPDDLKEALTRHSKAKKFFESLSYTNRKEYVVWISSAKKTETREKRVQQTIEKLLKELKNPSQK